MVTARIFGPAQDIFEARMEKIRDRVAGLRDMTNQARAGAQRVVDEVNREAARLGISPPEAAPVIDVGEKERPLVRMVRGAGFAVMAALLTSGLFCFVAFFLQFLFAIIIANRFLKIRIDLAVPSQV